MAFGLAQNAVLSKKGVQFLKDAWENGSRAGSKCSTVKKWGAIFEGCIGKLRSGWPKVQYCRKNGMQFLRDAWETGGRVGPKCSTVEEWDGIFEGCVGKWQSGWPKVQYCRTMGCNF